MIRRVVAYALLAELGATASMIATFRLATDNWGVPGFGEWIMSRRLIAFVVPIVTVGLDIGLVRALAQPRDSEDRCSELAALLIIIASSMLAGIVMIAFPETISTLVFGSAGHVNLVLPVLCVSGAYALHVFHYAALRGRANYMLANLAHVLVYGVIPLAMILAFPESITTTLFSTAATVFALTVVSLAVSSRWGQPTVERLLAAVQDLLAYSAPRMVSALLMIALTLLPASMAAASAGIEVAGFVALALSVVGIAATASAPIQVVLLPTAASMWAGGQKEQLISGFRKMELGIGVVGVVAIALMPMAAPVISAAIVGADDPLLRRTLIISSAAIGPFLYFVCGRQVVDACSLRPLNTYNLVISLAAFVFAALMLRHSGFSEVVIIVGSYVLAVIVLAVLTRTVIYRIFGLRDQTQSTVPRA